MSEDLERVWIHPDLGNEFRIWKADIEAKTGRPLKGGVPIVSKIFAQILKKHRLNDRKVLKIDMQKAKGINKNEIISL